MRELVLGIDSSTQSTKVVARDVATGAVVANGRSPHTVGDDAGSEQDPRMWWTALVAAVEQLGDARNEVVALAVAGQQHGLVLLDEDDQPVRPAPLWNDTASAPNAATLVQTLGAEHWASVCGSVPLASFTVTKLAWMAEHEPRTLECTARVMLPHDYLTYRLTGAHVTDRGDASGTGWFDNRTGAYLPQHLEAAGLDASWVDRLPMVRTAGAPVGTLLPEVAAALGLRADVVVAAGTGDNMAGAVGLGLGVGDVAMSLGTSGTVFTPSHSPTSDASGSIAGFANASGEGFLPLVCTMNATRASDAMAYWLGTDAVGLAALALAAPVGGPAPVFVPFLEGERTPNLPRAAGVLSALRVTTTREALALSAIDGVLCGLFEGVDRLAEAGHDVSGELFLIGGGAKSAGFRQRCADLRGTPIVVPADDEIVAAGAAVLAATALTEVVGPLIAGVAEWALGGGATIEPRVEATSEGAVRSAHRDAVAAVRREHERLT